MSPTGAHRGIGGVALFFEEFEAAVRFYEAALGPPAYAEGDDTRGWNVGGAWLTLLRREGARPRDVEFTLPVRDADEADRLQASFVAAGAEGDPPRDTWMYEPLHLCAIRDPFGAEILIVSPPRRPAAATPDPARGGRSSVESGTPWEPRVGYARAVRVGSSVWVSGTTSTDADGHILHADDAYAQAGQAIANIERALRGLGAGLTDVVRTRVYVRDPADWEAVARAHREAFGDVRPASTMVAAGLISPEMRVEIEADAIVGAGA